MISNIRIIHVSPEADRTGEILPHALIVPYGLLALTDKRIQPVLLDLLLAVQSELLLNLKLYGKTVGIPARLTGNHIALHGAVSGDHILDDTGKHVSYMRLAVCRGRSVIECISGTAFPDLHGFPEDVVVFPELLDFLLPYGEIEVSVYFAVHLENLLVLIYLSL